MAVPQQKLLQVFTKIHIQPAIGGEEAEAAARVQKRQAVEVEVDVEVAFAVGFVKVGAAGLVAEELGPGGGNGLLELGFVGFFCSFQRSEVSPPNSAGSSVGGAIISCRT